MKNSNSNDYSSWKTLAWASLIGVEVVACILIGYFAGSYLSNRTGADHWTAVGVIVGLIIGVTSIGLAIKRYLEDSNE